MVFEAALRGSVAVADEAERTKLLYDGAMLKAGDLAESKYSGSVKRRQEADEAKWCQSEVRNGPKMVAATDEASHKEQ